VKRAANAERDIATSDPKEILLAAECSPVEVNSFYDVKPGRRCRAPRTLEG